MNGLGLNLKELINEVNLFINENENEFEFIIDINDVENYEIDFSDNSINVNECCNVYIRKEIDIELEDELEEGVGKKVNKNGFLLYIIL